MGGVNTPPLSVVFNNFCTKFTHNFVNILLNQFLNSKRVNVLPCKTSSFKDVVILVLIIIDGIYYLYLSRNLCQKGYMLSILNKKNNVLRKKIAILNRCIDLGNKQGEREGTINSIFRVLTQYLQNQIYQENSKNLDSAIFIRFL